MKIEPMSEEEIKGLVKFMGWDNNDYKKRLLYTLAYERAKYERLLNGTPHAKALAAELKAMGWPEEPPR